MEDFSSDTGSRLTLAAAGIIGVIGIVSASMASHGDDPRISGAIASVCLAHAPALLALALYGLRGRLLLASAAMLSVGTAIFVGDLAVRQASGHGAFTLAAPLGGMLMIGGWVALILAAIFTRKRMP